MRINHNIAALNTYRQLGQANQANSNSMQKLSSGLRINNASDDAAGLAISEKMRGQIRGLEQAQTNAQDGISLVQTAEGALNETHSILQRMRELSVQASNDTNTADDRGEIQKEINQLSDEIDRVSNTTEFNTKNLLNGSVGTSVDDGTVLGSVSSSASTKAGTYTVNASGATLATKASETAASGVTESTAVNSAGTLTINDVNIDVQSGDTLGDVAKKITSSVNGVTASIDDSGNFNIESDEVGADQSITISGDAANILTASSDYNSSSATVNGTNITGVNVDGMGANANLSYDGNTVKVVGGDSEGLTMEVKKAETTDVTVNDSLTFQIGANEGQDLNLSINAMDTTNLGVQGIDVTTQEGASSAISKIDDAIKTVSGERSKLGAVQNRLDHTINNLGTSSENLTAAESRIRDVDYALAA
ncbi:flagellin [Halobacillus trueperi]|uniref:flagellin N-terminal helical domain-containing protein n=1 Tax=Halobacillus trueperi TaxID=156205 RepID=UPI003734D1D1